MFALRFLLAFCALAAAVVCCQPVYPERHGYTPGACATMTLRVSPKTVARGGTATASGSIKNCSAADEALMMHYVGKGPCGFSVNGSIEIEVKARATRSMSLPFTVPDSACAGTYTLTLAAYSGEARLASSSASITVR